MSAPRDWPADGVLTVTHEDHGSCWPVVTGVPRMGAGAYLVDVMDDDGALHEGTGGRCTAAASLLESFRELVKECRDSIPDEVVDRILKDDDGCAHQEAAEAMLGARNPSHAVAWLLACFPGKWWRDVLDGSDGWERGEADEYEVNEDDDRCRGCGRVVEGCAGECSACFPEA